MAAGWQESTDSSCHCYTLTRDGRRYYLSSIYDGVREPADGSKHDEFDYSKIYVESADAADHSKDYKRLADNCPLDNPAVAVPTLMSLLGLATVYNLITVSAGRKTFSDSDAYCLDSRCGSNPTSKTSKLRTYRVPANKAAEIARDIKANMGFRVTWA